MERKLRKEGLEGILVQISYPVAVPFYSPKKNKRRREVKASPPI